jgi:triacylglycerol lipase
MPQIPYNQSYKSLFRPGKADDFFQIGPIPRDEELCAEMSRLAYVTEEDRLRTYLARATFTLATAIGYGEPGMQVFVATSNDAEDPIAVTAFRGTEGDDPTDLFADVKFRTVDWDGAGKVNEGFRDEFAEVPVMRDRTTLIPAGTRALFTGHSLGGALATLAAALYGPDYLYTFGSPRVGDGDFASGMQGVSHSRYVDCCDLVAKAPPPTLFGYEYEHTGLLHYIDRDGTVMTSPPEQIIYDDQREASSAYDQYAVFKGYVPVRALADHAPINYVSAVMGSRA